MAWSIEWDGGYVTGGEGKVRLTPNFRLKEFLRPDGRVRVHRELVSALQILRERFGSPLSVAVTDDDGLGATLTCRSVPDLLAAADAVRAHRLFAFAEQQDDGVYVRIPDPDRLPEIELEQALETAFSVTSGFETSGDRFQQVTGNFDDAGMSFGPAQWNFRSGTLTPLFREFERADADSLRACFEDDIDYEEWRSILDAPVDEQISWADSVSTGRGKHDVMQPWKGYLQAVGRVEAFRAVMVEQALRKYGAKLLDAIRYLQGLAPGIEINHLRCMCSLYDLVIQQGSLARASAEIERRVATERPGDQFELVGIAVEERGHKASAAWRSDCVSRRLGILRGVPTTVEGRQRANINFYKLRDVCIQGARELLDSDVSEQLARVSQAIAAGDSTLA